MVTDNLKKGSAATQKYAVMAAEDAVNLIPSLSSLEAKQEQLDRIRVYLDFGRLPECDFTPDTMKALENAESKAIELMCEGGTTEHTDD
ncbi:hypothetical protein [Marinobacterium lutimaris]|uniref:Uncharacterized protein n=1 Tax=Marinobacterium lutimaris TaxID=568106 RepID=A0A1H6DWS3_9GAMM|nr:hypothetical protein [Marinobacterium lutimaris]SEG89649.1 hypothetical protein SAMN05444390_1152 [Marinobacterium lutimaris]